VGKKRSSQKEGSGDMNEEIYSFILFVILLLIIIILEAPKKEGRQSNEHNDA
jgi:hypothetical protein